MARPELLSRERAAAVFYTLTPSNHHRAEDFLTRDERRRLRLAFMRDDCYHTNLSSLLYALMVGATIWRGMEH